MLHDSAFFDILLVSLSHTAQKQKACKSLMIEFWIFEKKVSLVNKVI